VLPFTVGVSVQPQAAPICAHVGNNDPITENFDYWPWNGGMTTTALADDNGWATWQIANTSSPQQAVYSQKGGTGPYLPGGSGLTQPQIDDILANGFILSMRARIIDGPTYDEYGTQQVSAAIAVAGFANYRFDIALGSDGLGNTLVVLPIAINQVGSIFSYDPFGSPLLVPGTDYHLYQLSYDPLTQAADLYIDGFRKVTGFAGATVTGGAQANNFGLVFAAFNLATGNYALAKLESGQLAPTGIEDTQAHHSFALHQNVPNPFNPMTRISFDVPAGGGEVKLRVYDVEGKLVRTLADGYHTAGKKTTAWSGESDSGRDAASGIYFYRMTAPGFAQTRKMLLLR